LCPDGRKLKLKPGIEYDFWQNLDDFSECLKIGTIKKIVWLGCFSAIHKNAHVEIIQNYP
jgi:hypothetical protein